MMNYSVYMIKSNQIEKFSNLLDKAKKILSEKDLVSFYEAVFFI